MAALRFTFQVDGLPKESLVVCGFDGHESLSDSQFDRGRCIGFRYEVALASRSEDITPEQVVDKQAELHVYQDGELTQRVHGIVRSFTQGNIGHHHTFYHVTLIPALERLSLRHNSRIFQHKSSVDIVTTLLQEMGITEYAFSLKRQSEVREFCVQYRETDLDFVHRLAAEEGWTYSFEHQAGKHTLVFSDSSELLPKLGEVVPYNGNAGGAASGHYIFSFSQRTRAEVSEVTLKDYSFKKPQYSFLRQQVGAGMGYQREGYEHFDAPGRYKDDANGNAFSKVRLEYLRRESHLAFGQSNSGALRAGHRFELAEHLNAGLNRSWLVVRVTHRGEQPQALEEDATQGATTYDNTFEVIPATQNWQAPPQPKPQVDGPMMAIVVGPEGEEIYCDEFGRVKVHFPWDRDSKENELSSCWVRVSQGWAGGRYGMMAIPRVGHEVIVSFLHGDPDQPIITGRTYHATNALPYPLPDNKTRTVIRTDTHQGDGFNEISFDDKTNDEQLFIHAQKNQSIQVLNDKTQSVGHDETHSVGNDHSMTVSHDETYNVGNNQTIDVGQDRSLTVVQNETHTVQGDQNTTVVGKRSVRVEGVQEVDVTDTQTETYRSDQVIDVSGHHSLNVAETLMNHASDFAVYSSDESVYLQCGSSAIVISPSSIVLDSNGSTIEMSGDGITLNGMKVKLN